MGHRRVGPAAVGAPPAAAGSLRAGRKTSAGRSRLAGAAGSMSPGEVAGSRNSGRSWTAAGC